MDISTAISRALSVTVMESTTRTLSPATKVISPMKMAVTSFSSRSARNRARFSSTHVLAAKLRPASSSSTRAISVARSGLLQAEFQNVDDVASPGKRLRRGQCHEAPVLVVVVEAGIEYARDTKAARSRHHAEGREPALRTGKGHIVAGRDLPFLGELLADEQRVDTVGVGRKIKMACDNALQRLIVTTLAFRIDAFCHYAPRISAKRQQHRLIHRGCHGLYAWDGREFRGQRFVIVDAAGSGPGK